MPMRARRSGVRPVTSRSAKWMLPAAGRREPGEGVEAGGLARAIGPDEGGEPAGLEAEADVVQHHVAAEGLAQAARLEDGSHSPLRAASAARGARAGGGAWKPVGRRTRWMRPRMPSGMKRMMPMKRRP